MELIAQIPNEPIIEEWSWLTNVLLSDNATEQRICNADLPKRAFGLNLQFDDANDLRAHLAGMLLGSKTFFQVPLYQHSTRLKANAAAGASIVDIVAARSELRAGDAALLYDRQGNREAKVVDSLTSTSVTFTAPLGAAWGVSASICPIATVYSPGQASIAFGTQDHDATARLKLGATGFLNPFLNPYIGAALATLGGLPVLTARPIGTEYDDSFDTGVQPADEGGVVSIRSPWQHAHIKLSRTFKVDRVFNPSDWETWRLFADTVKGSWKPFYMPTYRQDFALAVAPVPGGTTLQFEGTAYNDDWFPLAPFKAVAIFYAGGVHYATVSACASVGGNSQVTFAPPLPGDAGAVDRVSLLLKLRIADDKVSCEHYGLYSRVTLNLRTVDE